MNSKLDLNIQESKWRTPFARYRCVVKNLRGHGDVSERALATDAGGHLEPLPPSYQVLWVLGLDPEKQDSQEVK